MSKPVAGSKAIILEPQKLEKLEKILTLANEDYVKSDDFVKVCQVLTALVQEIREEGDSKLSGSIGEIENRLNYLKTDYEASISDVKESSKSKSKELSDFKNQLSGIIKELRSEYKNAIEKAIGEMPPFPEQKELTADDFLKKLGSVKIPLSSIKDGETLASKKQLETAIIEIGGKLQVIEKRNAKGYGQLGGGSEGTGSLFLSRLRDVELPNNPTNGYVLTYDQATKKWYAAAASGGSEGTVSSVFGRTGAVIAQNGDYTTAQVTESGNLYYTDTRARAAITGTVNRITVTAGVVDISASYVGQNSITTLGTIGTGTWQGTSINTTYTDAKVVSVSGTLNRITSSGGDTPVIDISASYVGQSSITTLGTITTGVWNGTVVGATYGGTGINNAGRTITITTTSASFTFSGAFVLTVPATGTAVLGTGAATRIPFFSTANTVTTNSGFTYTTASGAIANSVSANGSISYIQTNANAGTAASSFVQVSNGTDTTFMQHFGTGFTPSGARVASMGKFATSSSVGMIFGNLTAGTYMKWFIGVETTLGNEIMRAITGASTGNLSIGTQADPTAALHLRAGSATANTAPLQFNTGGVETTARAGVVEYNNSLYATKASTLRFGIGGTIYDYNTDVSVGGAEADIYTSTTPANTLGADKEKLIAEYGGNFVTVGTELTQLKVYFAGTAIYDSTALAPATGTTSWRVYVEIIRVSSTVVRYTVSLNTSGATGYTYCAVGELTGLTLSNTNILKVTGTSSGVGSGVGDVIGKMGYVSWSPSASL